MGEIKCGSKVTMVVPDSLRGSKSASIAFVVVFFAALSFCGIVLAINVTKYLQFKPRKSWEFLDDDILLNISLCRLNYVSNMGNFIDKIKFVDPNFVVDGKPVSSDDTKMFTENYLRMKLERSRETMKDFCYGQVTYSVDEDGDDTVDVRVSHAHFPPEINPDRNIDAKVNHTRMDAMFDEVLRFVDAEVKSQADTIFVFNRSKIIGLNNVKTAEILNEWIYLDALSICKAVTVKVKLCDDPLLSIAILTTPAHEFSSAVYLGAGYDVGRFGDGSSTKFFLNERHQVVSLRAKKLWRTDNFCNRDLDHNPYNCKALCYLSALKDHDRCLPYYGGSLDGNNLCQLDMIGREWKFRSAAGMKQCDIANGCEQWCDADMRRKALCAETIVKSTFYKPTAFVREFVLSDSPRLKQYENSRNATTTGILDIIIPD